MAPLYYAPAGAVFGSTTISIHAETHCLGACPSSGVTYMVNPDPMGNADIYSIGSEKIYSILSSKDTATLLYRDCQMKHGLDDDCGAGCYQSDFGTGDTDKADTYKYIATRAANFFQVVIHYGSANHYLNSIRFTDCEDYRHLCEITDHDNGCINGQTCP